MTCWECQETIAASTRQPEPPAAVAEHLAACAPCREFAAEWTTVGALLADWQAPVPAGREAAAAREAIVARLTVAPARAAPARPVWLGRVLASPAVLAVPSAAAVAAGAAAAPAWLQNLALGWFAAATGCTLLVLLYHGRCAVSEGEGV